MIIKKNLCFLFCILLIVSPLQADEKLPPPNIAAPVALVMDADTKTVLYEKNGYEQHYPASITKLMTALLAIENLSPTDTLTFSKDAIWSIERGSSHIGIDVGEQLTVDQALHALLLMSANEVANGLAEAVAGSIDNFATLMTSRAKQLGAKNTHFMNPHGLFNKEHYTTAYDMALIGSYLAKNDYFLNIMKDTTYQIQGTNKTDETRYLYQQHHMVNPKIDIKVNREDVIGGKTGYTDESRHTLVTMAKQGDITLVAVVLQSEKSSIYTDTSKLLDFGFASYHAIELHNTQEIIKTLPIFSVKSGQAYQSANCGLALAKDVTVTVPNSLSKEDIIPSFDIPNELDASYQIGDKIGEVYFNLGPKTLAKSPLILKQIEMLPEPPFSIKAMLSIIPKKWIIFLSVLAVLIACILITLLIKHKRQHKKLSNLKKLFK